jgi:predicted ribosomally synthesized peptide with SipW-like signal peptide
MSRTKTVLRSLIVIGAALAVAAIGTFSAFSSTTESPDNRVVAGDVQLTDNDLGAAMYDVSGAKPGDQIERCIRISYSGLDADVKLYAPDAIGPLGQYLTLKVEQGTQASPSFPDCTGFSATKTVFDTGTLADFATAHNAWGNGLADNPGAATKWANGNSVIYRVTLTVQDNDLAQGQTTNLHRLVWEARNQ